MQGVSRSQYSRIAQRMVALIQTHINLLSVCKVLFGSVFTTVVDGERIYRVLGGIPPWWRANIFPSITYCRNLVLTHVASAGLWECPPTLCPWGVSPRKRGMVPMERISPRSLQGSVLGARCNLMLPTNEDVALICTPRSCRMANCNSPQTLITLAPHCAKNSRVSS